MIELVNGLIDKLIAVAWRLLDLPTYALALLALPLFLLALRWADTKRRRVTFLLLSGLALPLVIGLWADSHLRAQRKELEGLNHAYLQALLWNDSAELPLPGLLQLGLESTQRRVDEGILLTVVRRSDPRAAAFIVSVDLTHPGVEVVITPRLEELKTLTSVFARSNDCVVAINGEAGEGPEQKSGFGEWVGNWVVAGQAVMLADTARSPFLSFDPTNRARYSPAREVVTELSPTMHNALWGRMDLLVGGEIPEFEDPRSYSRTAMGIDAEGRTLYLAVVDGKRPAHSLGLTYRELAEVMIALGAEDAMACDQGGSSAMYLAPLGGILNRPADNQAVERPVYTHFGIRLHR